MIHILTFPGMDSFHTIINILHDLPFSSAFSFEAQFLISAESSHT